MDPYFQKDLVSAKLIKSIQVSGDTVTLEIALG
ncbi:MAG: hypothetical protein BWK79_11585, partial [Beggiatoa sp. IS2]